MNFLTENPFLVLALLLLLGLMVFSARTKKRLEAEHEEQKRTMREQMVPGVWVMTGSGFWGRFVDIDGETVILETADGTETYWKSAAIVSVGESPFPDEDESVDTEESEDDDDAPILGMSDEANGPSAR